MLEARRRRAVRDVGRLRRLALAAIGQAPDFPFGTPGDRVAGVPELRRDAGIGRVLEKPAALAVDDLVGKLRAELEVEAFVIDAPTPVRLHVHAVSRFSD